MKEFIFFRSDRLGDFLIITNLIKALKKKYPESKITIISSKYNNHFIKKYKIIDNVILYDKKFNFLKKIKNLKKIISKKYFASFAIDGKSFSFLCNLFLKADLKFGLFYRFKFFGVPILKPNALHTFFCDYYETFTSKKHLDKIEHLPSKLINLSNHLNLGLKPKDRYYYLPTYQTNKLKSKYRNLIKSKFVLLHLDEKWIDIKNIKDNFYKNLVLLQKKINKKLLITTFNNKFDYFINLKRELKKNKNDNIIILENSNLDIMERMIYFSLYSISCHSGFLVQIAGTNNSRIIDIINKKDLTWYSCWVPKNTFHKFVLKSNKNINFELKKIFSNISNIIKKT